MERKNNLLKVKFFTLNAPAHLPAKYERDIDDVIVWMEVSEFVIPAILAELASA